MNIGQVVVGNVGDNSVNSCLRGVARGSRQPMTGRLVTYPNNTTVNQEIDSSNIQAFKLQMSACNIG